MTAQFGIGACAVVIAVMAAWAFRSSAAPLWARLVLPVAAVAAACLVPYLDASLADEHRVTTLDKMPSCFAILALRAHDADGTVDLWVEGSGRLVNLPMDGIKDTLRDVQTALRKGEPKVKICKQSSQAGGAGSSTGEGGPGTSHPGAANGGSASRMKIDKSLFLHNLKESGQ